MCEDPDLASDLGRCHSRRRKTRVPAVGTPTGVAVTTSPRNHPGGCRGGASAGQDVQPDGGAPGPGSQLDQVSRRAVQEGISPSRAQDLVIAVHEIAANTVVHAGGAGILRIWRDGLSLVCEIGDDGRITDPLAGRHPDSPHDDSGHGLRIAHELCDLVQLRSGPWGTTVRLHMLAG